MRSTSPMPAGGDLAQLYNAQGVALANLARFQESLASFDRAVALNNGFAAAHSNRGNVLKDLGRVEEALRSYKKATKLNPLAADAFNNQGVALKLLGRRVEALVSYDKAISLKPDYMQAHNNRANLLRELARPAEALKSCDRAIGYKPDYAEAHSNRAMILLDLLRLDEALASCDRAIALVPTLADAHNFRGNALKSLGRPTEALMAFDTALTLKPNDSSTLANKSILLTELGRLQEGLATIEGAVRNDPKNARLLYVLSQYKRFTPSDAALIETMTQVTSEATRCAQDRIEAGFALGKVLADTGAKELSFRHFRDANSLKRRETAYDEGSALSMFDRIRSVFDRDFVEDAAGCGDPSHLPVFILGMPRSGSTLVEQILAAHPDVHAAGETGAFQASVATLGGGETRCVDEPEMASRMSRSAFARIGATYAAHLQEIAPEALRVTNKLPDNFRLAGLIHLALPKARIIHTRRDPIDTCVSCFSTLFFGHQPFTYDLAELGRYYRAYEALMAHWRAVLPPDTILDVEYEDVVDDLEGQARRIIAHCGLAWDPGCLNFTEGRHAVSTASATQVRQKIYRSSVGRWRAYEASLQPLLKALGQDDHR
ncbi:tetratricopeptide repeat-containing sulfotransferase family protein [Lichenifustis flavocetrariae]|uniref:Sulfotransferase n=1 Tax=Lichenifustis flavocetrariae TaxID=2949735 RepID=A0AA41Z2H1_9HYPH|nr:sulfotransferase [Lichenifustis flavocetrariae]MCW6509145.1 sulfotransferase [Lichenifustis flavocetrariae]